MSEAFPVTYVIVGPNRGKTMTINGRDFLEGRHEHVGPSTEHATLHNLFSRFYSVFPEVLADEEQAKYDALLSGEPLPEPKPAAAPVPTPVAAPVPAPTTEVTKEVEAQDAPQDNPEAPGSTGQGTEGADKPEGEQANQERQVITLAEAIGLLDPEVDDHWTSNNLPALDVLSDLQGGAKVGRADVEAVAAGYTRSAARKARQ